ncbi:MAG TPA: DUF4124 domain-containing protein [Gammaproteobacteria bacterium]
MNIKISIAAALAASLLTMGAARADTPIYKWVDDKGQVHYSTEPHSGQAQQLEIKNSGTLPNPGDAPPPGTPAAPASPANDAKLVAPKPEDSPACKAGRDRLFKYLHADSLYQLDDKGNKQPLPPAEKQKALDEARAYIVQACGGDA